MSPFTKAMPLLFWLILSSVLLLVFAYLSIKYKGKQTKVN